MTTETPKPEDNNDELTTLRKHNADLTRDLKVVKASLAEIQAAKEEAEAEAVKASGDVDKALQQQAAKHKKEIDKLIADNEVLSSDLRTIRVDNEINQTIASLGIMTAHIPAVEALLHRKVQYADGQATIDGKAIAEWASEWSAKDGAIYRPAPNNSGAGAMGNDGAKANTLSVPKSATELTSEHYQLAKSDPTAFNSLMEQGGLSIRA